MQVGKLNPQPTARLNFPGFQEILDFTSAGSESSVSVTVDGDTDKEYKIIIRNLTSQQIYIRPNNDSGATNYGYQYLLNNAGTITAARNVTTSIFPTGTLSEDTYTFLTPTGFLKTAFNDRNGYTSGTTIGLFLVAGSVWNSTSNVTSLDFVSASGNFTTGTRITVYARRSN